MDTNDIKQQTIQKTTAISTKIWKFFDQQTISYCCLAMENGGVMDFGVKNELVVSLTRQTVDVCWRAFCEWMSGLSIAS